MSMMRLISSEAWLSMVGTSLRPLVAAHHDLGVMSVFAAAHTHSRCCASSSHARASSLAGWVLLEGVLHPYGRPSTLGRHARVGPHPIPSTFSVLESSSAASPQTRGTTICDLVRSITPVNESIRLLGCSIVCSSVEQGEIAFFFHSWMCAAVQTLSSS